ncbi:hypothetical protein AB1286_02480 [Trinickia sp. NRRL B-1857]|uniref:hypothetical protein n=1 Tax=Trinickia sp. NRRL B-1857 TaxID=3162879 RepID=UPI003D29612A
MNEFPFRDSLAKRLYAALVVPRPLDEVDFKLDDELARKVGSVIFGLLAVHQQGLKQHISMTSNVEAVKNSKPPTY